MPTAILAAAALPTETNESSAGAIQHHGTDRNTPNQLALSLVMYDLYFQSLSEPMQTPYYGKVANKTARTVATNWGSLRASSHACTNAATPPCGSLRGVETPIVFLIPELRSIARVANGLGYRRRRVL